RRERLYTESEVRLAQAFADQIAVAMHNALLAEQKREAPEAASRQRERLRTLALITEPLLTSCDPGNALQVVVLNTHRRCSARRAPGCAPSSRRRCARTVPCWACCGWWIRGRAR